MCLKDFDMELPLITHVVMSPWFALTFPALAVLAVCLELFRYRRAALVNTAIFVVLYLLWELFVQAMFLPLLHLIKSALRIDYQSIPLPGRRTCRFPAFSLSRLDAT